MQIQRGERDISPSQIHEKKKEKKENILNCSIIKCLTFGVPFLRSRCLEWQICEAHCFESHFCKFLVVRIQMKRICQYFWGNIILFCWNWTLNLSWVSNREMTVFPYLNYYHKNSLHPFNIWECICHGTGGIELKS